MFPNPWLLAPKAVCEDPPKSARQWCPRQKTAQSKKKVLKYRLKGYIIHFYVCVIGWWERLLLFHTLLCFSKTYPYDLALPLTGAWAKINGLCYLISHHFWDQVKPSCAKLRHCRTFWRISFLAAHSLVQHPAVSMHQKSSEIDHSAPEDGQAVEWDEVGVSVWQVNLWNGKLIFV